MAEAHGRDEWDRTAAIMATVINVNGGKKGGRPVEPAELNPYVRRGQGPRSVPREAWINAVVAEGRRRRKATGG